MENQKHSIVFKVCDEGLGFDCKYIFTLEDGKIVSHELDWMDSLGYLPPFTLSERLALEQLAQEKALEIINSSNFVT